MSITVTYPSDYREACRQGRLAPFTAAPTDDMIRTFDPAPYYLGIREFERATARLRALDGLPTLAPMPRATLDRGETRALQVEASALVTDGVADSISDVWDDQSDDWSALVVGGALSRTAAPSTGWDMTSRMNRSRSTRSFTGPGRVSGHHEAFRRADDCRTGTAIGRQFVAGTALVHHAAERTVTVPVPARVETMRASQHQGREINWAPPCGPLLPEVPGIGLRTVSYGASTGTALVVDRWTTTADRTVSRSVVAGDTGWWLGERHPALVALRALAGGANPAAPTAALSALPRVTLTRWATGKGTDHRSLVGRQGRGDYLPAPERTATAGPAALRPRVDPFYAPLTPFGPARPETIALVDDQAAPTGRRTVRASKRASWSRTIVTDADLHQVSALVEAASARAATVRKAKDAKRTATGADAARKRAERARPSEARALALAADAERKRAKRAADRLAALAALGTHQAADRDDDA